jgi:hypothetical protein
MHQCCGHTTSQDTNTKDDKKQIFWEIDEVKDREQM